MIDCADAREWMKDFAYRADLVLTDPPHLDAFLSADHHFDFVKEWYPLAFEALKGTILIHSCGQNPLELRNYLESSKYREPDQIRIWQHEVGFHFHLVYGTILVPAVFDDRKPDPLWKRIITKSVPNGAVVMDPFCGRGEIPLAAESCGRRILGCDINPDSVAYCRSQGL